MRTLGSVFGMVSTAHPAELVPDSALNERKLSRTVFKGVLMRPAALAGLVRRYFARFGQEK